MDIMVHGVQCKYCDTSGRLQTIVMLILILLYAIPWIQADIEIVSLEDINDDHEKRNLYRGLPATLEFNLKRDSGNNLKLRLEENKRLNKNAPVYRTVIEEGEHRVVKLETKRIVGSKYYIDKKTGVAVQVSCKIQPVGPCRRIMEGILEIDGYGYEIRPSSEMLKTRSLNSSTHVPHEIERHVPSKKQHDSRPEDSDNVNDELGTSFLRKPEMPSMFEEIAAKVKSLVATDMDKSDQGVGNIEETASHNTRNLQNAQGAGDDDPYLNDYLLPPDKPPWENQRSVGTGKTHLKRNSETGDDDPYLNDYLLPPDTTPWENQRTVGTGKTHLKRNLETGDDDPYLNDYLLPPDTPPWENQRTVGTGKTHLKRNLETGDDDPYLTDYLLPPDTPPWENQRTVGTGKTHLKRNLETGDDDPYLTDYLLPPDTPPWENQRSFGIFLPQLKVGTGKTHLKRNLDTAPLENEPPVPQVGTVQTHLKRNLETDDDDPYLHDYLLPPDTLPWQNERSLGSFPPPPNVKTGNDNLKRDSDRGLHHQGNETEVRGNNIQKRQTLNEYTVETLVVIDPFLWKKYFDATIENNGMTQDEATMYRLRQRMAMLINCVNLRYATIDDPEIAIYFTISGFVFCKENDGSAPLPLTVDIPVANGKQYVEGPSYMYDIPKWLWKQQGLPSNDLVMVMTSLDLYKNNISRNSVAGVAFTGVVCDWYRVSLHEDAMFYDMMSVVAHELAHNLGSPHDGKNEAADCPPSDHFMMDPYLKTFYENTPYTRNPWRFSDCTVNIFKSKLPSVTCLGSDNVVFYDKAEYDAFNELAPGEVFTPDDQCKMAKGETSYSCKSDEDESICLKLTCHYNGGCYYYPAAYGTPCGVKSLNKWCVEGQCVPRSGIITTAKAPTTTTTTTTKGPTSTTQKQLSKSCVDIGWKYWSCRKISKYFKATFGFLPSYWCRDPYWDHTCCALCAAHTKFLEGGTTTTEPPTTTTTECVDKGYKTWKCSTVSAYFKKRYGLLPQRWCSDPDWNENCCEFCANNGG
ncbi:uncharacterized protein LOC123536674 isoform X5 [Mercenaria mercenaria]|uniref:uncharacterized protein LOC123536674 isoform X5 n=1 Tax=Mercenaria mercenaria TaxID=6596 RepID=UPI00234F0C16|nr:uncharacterized protein LOC123536674 isoform X5 [Mercenaria mercenaria]